MFDAQQYRPWAVVAGASEGVGESFARRLGKEGLNLVLIARKQASLEQVAQQVRTESGVQVRTLALDLTSADVLERVCAITDDIEVGLLVMSREPTRAWSVSSMRRSSPHSEWSPKSHRTGFPLPSFRQEDVLARTWRHHPNRFIGKRRGRHAPCRLLCVEGLHADFRGRPMVGVAATRGRCLVRRTRCGRDAEPAASRRVTGARRAVQI